MLGIDVLLEILAALLPSDTPEHLRRKIGFSIVGQCLFYRVAGDVVEMLVPSDELDVHFTIEQLAEHVTRMTLLALERIPQTAAG